MAGSCRSRPGCSRLYRRSNCVDREACQSGRFPRQRSAHDSGRAAVRATGRQSAGAAATAARCRQSRRSSRARELDGRRQRVWRGSGDGWGGEVRVLWLLQLRINKPSFSVARAQRPHARPPGLHTAHWLGCVTCEACLLCTHVEPAGSDHSWIALPHTHGDGTRTGRLQRACWPAVKPGWACCWPGWLARLLPWRAGKSRGLSSSGGPSIPPTAPSLLCTARLTQTHALSSPPPVLIHLLHLLYPTPPITSNLHHTYHITSAHHVVPREGPAPDFPARQRGKCCPPGLPCRGCGRNLDTLPRPPPRHHHSARARS